MRQLSRFKSNFAGNDTIWSISIYHRFLFEHFIYNIKQFFLTHNTLLIKFLQVNAQEIHPSYMKKTHLSVLF